jgi:hypothetical protein
VTDPEIWDPQGRYFRNGQIRELPSRARLVRLRHCFRKDGAGPPWWEVEDVFTGITIHCPQGNLGPMLNDMEVIAWAARGP